MFIMLNIYTLNNNNIYLKMAEIIGKFYVRKENNKIVYNFIMISDTNIKQI